jgi:hypothetical protein
VKGPSSPRLDERRTAEFAAELRARARAWLPSWGIVDGERDVGAALLDIAARFSSEVAERLDRGGEKMRRGFLDWLAVRGVAARPARMPVAFKLADAAQVSVLAEAPVRLQADAGGASVVFETEQDVRVVPGRLQLAVGVDADADAFYLTPPGISDLEPLEPIATQWELKSFAAAGSRKLQLDPDAGLAAEMIVEAGGGQYRVTQADKGIVTIEPPLDADLPASASVRKVTSFSPFDGSARNRQEHALYLGHMDLLNVEAAATIDVIGATTHIAGLSWQYWGKVGESDEVGWQPLTPATKQKRPRAVTLQKGKGAIEPREIGAGNSSRWIRAYAPKATGTAPMLQADTLKLLVNCQDAIPPCADAAPPGAAPAAEAMANTTPLVLDSVFFPLGKEPRQFDAFYLGSQEAFSKKAAKVQLCFEMVDPTFSALSALREGPLADRVLAGVAADRALHLFLLNPTTRAVDKFREREPLQPPQPGYFVQTKPSPTVSLDRQPPWRLPVWFEPPVVNSREGFRVATSAGDTIWVWHEDSSDATKSGWESFGAIPATNPPATSAVSGLVHLADVETAAPIIVVLRDHKMWTRGLASGDQWTSVDTLSGKQMIELESIVPVIVKSTAGRPVTSKRGGMIGISGTGELFRVTADGACTALLSKRKFRTDVPPAAIEVATGDLVVVAVEPGTPQNLVAYRQTVTDPAEVALDSGTSVIGSVEVALLNDADTVHVFAAVDDGNAGRLTTWTPFQNGAAEVRFDSKLTASGGQVGGAPTLVGTSIVMPGNRADILVSEFDPARRHAETGTIETGVVVPSSIALDVGDLIVRHSENATVVATITKAGLTKDADTFYAVSADFPAGSAQLNAYDLSATLSGKLSSADTLELDPLDQEAVKGSWLYFDSQFFRVKSIDRTDGRRDAKLDPSTTVDPLPTTTDYVRAIATGGRVAPFIDMSPPMSGKWDSALLARLPLIFPALTPREMRGKAFSLGVGNQPGVVVLDGEFQSVQPPDAKPVTFAIDDAVGDWTRLLGNTAANPELSWEYWNGKGWWKLHVTLDETRHLKNKGAVRFDVPSDIASSDWAGKTNYWIRARLIGGDYGRETVTVKSKVVDGVTEQTVERSSKGIRAPSVLKLSISYGVCDGTLPTFVLAQDSGSLRDESEANRTADARVEAFVPLAVTLSRLSNDASTSDGDAACPPDCGCQGTQPAPAATATDTANATASDTVTGRALLLGLDTAPSGAPVNVFLLVEHERDHGAFAPLVVEALVADRFVPIVARDATRGLGESGVVSMAFTVEPTRRELFGQSLTWIRLAPAAGADATSWQPSLRGAYLNAVWASATETLTRELLGSSEGAPMLTLRLARPPVLHDTLELRVREPLGEEERTQLTRLDKQCVLSNVDGLPGDWVLWTRVTDPGDEPAMARVYALDEATGIVRFGDGLHGMIPPIGVDAIVAFSYQRTEPPVPGSDSAPANLVAPRAPLNLVSPVESVEAVMSIDRAAGGAPSEPDDRVLRFGFARVRHRNRAVTLRDIEDLALQSSPEIAQARAFARRSHVRLVVAMRGADPIPSAAQIRELRRLLLGSAPTSLGIPDALKVTGPALRRLRVELTLRVDALDHAGALLDAVKRRLYALFDTATGGVAHDGWPLGASPGEGDIALALIDVPHLDSILEVALREGADDEITGAWPTGLAPHELAVLDEDPIRVQLETAEVTV